MVKWLIFGCILATLFLLLVRLRNLYQREKRLLREDSKTGALSERGLIEALKDESKRSRRHLRPLTVVYVDLDNFSAVNGYLGYDTGDAVLKVVARTLRVTLREVDVVARRQGDEFVLLLPETGAEGVPLVLGKLQKALREAMMENKWPVTSSIGAVTFRQPLNPVEAMITASSNVMFSAAKHSGKDRLKHLVFEAREESDNLVNCPKCRASFSATGHASCPTCGNAALSDVEPGASPARPWISLDSLATETDVCVFRFSLDSGKVIEFHGPADITKQKVEAIVSAANSSLIGTAGVDKAIHRAGGPSILKECQRIAVGIGRLAAGKAIITTGGSLPAKYVIHTVGPFYREGDRDESETLASCYGECIRIGDAQGITSLAFPSISTGTRGYPAGAAARVAVSAVAKALDSTQHLSQVRFVLFDLATLVAYVAAAEEFVRFKDLSPTHDRLTGLKSRRTLNADLERLLQSPQKQFTLLLMDIDDFKRVNDVFGHTAGDDMLRAFAQCLAKMPDSYRLGGDELVAIVRSADKTEAARLAESIRAEIEGLVFQGYPGLRLTISVGLATSPEDGSTPEAVLRSADAAMYESKHDGGNRVRACSEANAKTG